jgi:hypothetical protein
MAIGLRLAAAMAGNLLETSGFGVVLYDQPFLDRREPRNPCMCLKELRAYLGFLSVDEITAHVETGALPKPCNGRRIGEIGAAWDRDEVDRCLAAIVAKQPSLSLKEDVR